MGNTFTDPVENWTVGGFFGDAAKTTGKFIASPFVKLYGAVTNAPGDGISFLKKDDDNDHIYVPEGTKSLLGDDFTSLYPSSKTVEMTNADGSTSKYIQCTGSYATEMKSGNASSNYDISYDNMSSDKVKAIYEITLLSKKYASVYDQSNPTGNDKAAEEYASKMSQYKAYCDSNDIEWTDVLGQVSTELQTESYEYNKESSGIIRGKSADNNRIIANRAHGMLKECMPEGYEDKLVPALENKMSYEDTLDTEPHVKSWLNNIGLKFSAAIAAFKERTSNFHPFQSIKEAAIEYKDGLKVHYDNMDSINHPETNKDYANHMMSSDFQNGGTETSDENQTNYGDKADEAFGDITDGADSADNAFDY